MLPSRAPRTCETAARPAGRSPEPVNPALMDCTAPPRHQSRQLARGSGFVIDKAGHVVTNYHVVQGVQRVEVSFSSNERLPARIVGRDPSTDIAVLQVRERSRAFTPLSLGNSDVVRVGDSV